MTQGCFINGSWITGDGVGLVAFNPSTGERGWSAAAASIGQVGEAIAAARSVQNNWESVGSAERIAIVERFAALVGEEADRFAAIISTETGKPRWEAKTEVDSVRAKAGLAIEAFTERTPPAASVGAAELTHRALGVLAVLGPYNFPAHLANGQILPALVAGNTVVYKPSELTPATAAFHVELLHRAGLADGVINLVTGGGDIGAALVAGPVDGVAFTGSVPTGLALQQALASRPEVLLALEMGGNNPMVVEDWDDLEAAVNVIIRSAFITAGQRCTCTRRLYLPDTAAGSDLLDALVDAASGLVIAGPDTDPEPFAGPVISERAADGVRDHIAALAGRGAKVLTGPGDRIARTGFVNPTIIDITSLDGALPDEEVFGPVLTVERVGSFSDAVAKAADTRYGLAAGLLSTSRDRFDQFRSAIRAGVINWNTPTTGASGRLPFGGVGLSGNHRPAGWAAADFCSYPVATMVAPSVTEAAAPVPGFTPTRS